MSIILHMSDMHITEATASEAAELLSYLSSFLNESYDKREIKYIVNTGDFIDQRDVAIKVLDQLRTAFPDFNRTISAWETALRSSCSSDDAYYLEHKKQYTRMCTSVIDRIGGHLKTAFNNNLSAACKELFGIVAELYTKFTDALNVNRDNVIVSCGNHDRTWLLGENDIECTAVACSVNTRDRFTVFEEFCKNAHFSFVGGASPSTKPADTGLCFLGFDSVSPNPGNGFKYCNFCKSFDNGIIGEIADKDVIAVTHKPVDDYCDEAKTEYNEIRSQKVDAFIKQHSRYVLQGDKHGFSVEHNIVRCGAPLIKPVSKDDVPIRYTIIDTETWEYTPIKYNNNSWDFDNLQEVIKKTYEVSKDSIVSNVTTDFQNHGQFGSAQDIVTASNSIISEQLSIAFRAVGEYRIGGNRNNIDDLWSKGDIFDFLFERIKNSDCCNPLNLRGAQGSGKSTLLIELYCNLLNRVYSGCKEIIPLYFNFHTCLQAPDHENQDSLFKTANTLFDDFVVKAKRLKRSLSPSHRTARFLYMIDGLDELNFYGVEGAKLCAHINSVCEDIEGVRDLYILSIHQYKKSSTLDRLEWYYHGNSDVLYLDPIYLVTITDIEKQKQDAFFSAINTVFSANHLNQATVFPLVKSGRVTADIGLLHFLFGNRNDELNMRQSSPHNPDKWYQVIRYFDCTQRIMGWKRNNNEQQEHLKKAAYDYLTLDGFDYATVLCSATEFQLILGNESVRNMLCAEYFVDLFVEAKVSSWKPFMTHDLALFICAALSKKYKPYKANDMRRFLAKCAENAENIVSAQLLSILIYIVGQLVSTEVDDAVRSELIHNLSERSRNPTAFDVHCLSRSANIALSYMAFANNTTSEKIEDLLAEIVFHKGSREYARVFLLNYYGDAAKNYKSIEMLINGEYTNGFDFDLAFRNLKSLLKNEDNPVYLYNAFMLASFVKSRLCVRNNPNTSRLSHPFFFEQSYSDLDIARDMAVLDDAISCAQKASDFANTRITQPVLRAAYQSSLTEMQLLFIDCKEFLSNKLPKEEMHYRIALRAHPEYAFDKLRQLSYYGRSCWDYNKNPKATSRKDENAILQKNTSQYTPAHEETIIEHVYESMLIAFLYLPENAPDLPLYSKRDILSIIFTHEFGVAVCGDIPSSSKRYGKYEKQIENAEFFFSLWSNMFLKVASTHELFGLSVKYTSADKKDENTDINSQIAFEITQIQREYKKRLVSKKLNRNYNWIEEPNPTKWNRYTKGIYEMLLINNPRFLH